MKATPREQLAIMRGVDYGLSDRGVPGLSFTTYLDEGTAASQWLFGEDADRVFRDSRATSLRDLEGAACWVVRDGPFIRFVRVWQS